MRIGIITTWFERGAAYVSKYYRNNLIDEGNDVYIYARGGEVRKETAEEWSDVNVEYGLDLADDNIDPCHFFKWIKKHALEVVFFNEQRSFDIVAKTKKKFPDLVIGCYVDYYTELTIPWFNIYDFLICNTKRHSFAMNNHPQMFYLRWGTDTQLFTPDNRQKADFVRFFHSVGMSYRKGTDILVNSYINNQLYNKSKLIIHSQISIDKVCCYAKKDLEAFGIEVIEKTVTAPGLYHLGDVYVYPTKLDGLGLTMYEAMACGMPVITTNNAPMNEIVDNSVGRLVDVDYYYCRQDGYYWPMSVCSQNALSQAMQYYIDHPQQVQVQGNAARELALKTYNWKDRAKELNHIFHTAKARKINMDAYHSIMNYYSNDLLKRVAGCLVKRSQTVNKAYNVIRRQGEKFKCLMI